MLSEIETAILDRLEEKLLLPARKMAVGSAGVKGGPRIAAPTVRVATGGGAGSRVGQKTYHVKPRIFVFVEFSNLRDEKARRHGVYPIVLAIIHYLVEQKLGLDILPLSFVRFDHTTSDQEAEHGLINYTLEFATTFEVKRLDDEEADDLITLGLSYLLKPGDDEADMEGEVDLAAEEA